LFLETTTIEPIQWPESPNLNKKQTSRTTGSLRRGLPRTRPNY
ncbi:hypothetical protein SNEBB_002828, partial [Seison nebaliae]